MARRSNNTYGPVYALPTGMTSATLDLGNKVLVTLSARRGADHYEIQYDFTSDSTRQLSLSPLEYGSLNEAMVDLRKRVARMQTELGAVLVEYLAQSDYDDRYPRYPAAY